jgi:hypothetical protein
MARSRLGVGHRIREALTMSGHRDESGTPRPGWTHPDMRQVLYQEPRILYVLIWLVCFIYGVRWIVDRSLPQPISTWLGCGFILFSSYLWLWRSRRIGVGVSEGAVLHLMGLFVTRSIPIEEITEIKCPLRGPLVVVTKAGQEVSVRVGPRWGPKREHLLRDLQAQLQSR